MTLKLKQEDLSKKIRVLTCLCFRTNSLISMNAKQIHSRQKRNGQNSMGEVKLWPFRTANGRIL